MMRLNLLPHREWALQRLQLRFKWSLAGAMAVGVAVALAYYATLQVKINRSQANQQTLQAETLLLERQIQDMARVELDMATLSTQLQAVADLQSSRNLPVRLLSEIARCVPQDVYLLSLRQDKESLTLQGVAKSSERVSALLRALGSSAVFAKAELVEIVATRVGVTPGAQRRVFNFTLQLKWVPPPGGFAVSLASAGGTPAAVQPFKGRASP